MLSKIKLYADDALLYNTIHTQQDCEQLQKDLDLHGNWADKWKMVFNHHKCEFLRITNKKHPTLYKYYRPIVKRGIPEFRPRILIKC